MLTLQAFETLFFLLLHHHLVSQSARQDTSNDARACPSCCSFTSRARANAAACACSCVTCPSAACKALQAEVCARVILHCHRTARTFTAVHCMLGYTRMVFQDACFMMPAKHQLCMLQGLYLQGLYLQMPCLLSFAEHEHDNHCLL